MTEQVLIDGKPTNVIIQDGKVYDYGNQVTLKACGCQFRWVHEALSHVHSEISDGS